jgi:hypothetical protein
MQLIIHTSPAFQPEKDYIWHVVFGEILGISYQVVAFNTNTHTFSLPNGTQFQIPDAFASLSADMEWNYTLETHGAFEPDFDLFAFCFFMLTRLEEQKAVERDQHGRFPARLSWSARHGMLQRPLVNECAEWIWNKLLHFGWTEPRRQKIFQWQFSCDVDHPKLWWSITDRIKTVAGSILMRHSIKEALYWLKNPAMFQPKARDPFDVFDEWMDLFEQNGHQLQFNFLGDRPQTSNCWYPLNHPFIVHLMQRIDRRGHVIGFHPSYEAFEDEAIFKRELKSIQAIAPSAIVSGRQHYLRFSNPQTWQMWEEAGLKMDGTLGYAESDGFRCGICHDYPVFDVRNRVMLNLREQPLILMDVTLAQYQSLTPDQGLEKIANYHSVVKSYHGTLTLLWHNSSWNTPAWEPWKYVLKEALRL